MLLFYYIIMNKLYTKHRNFKFSSFLFIKGIPKRWDKGAKNVPFSLKTVQYAQIKAEKFVKNSTQSEPQRGKNLLLFYQK